MCVFSHLNAFAWPALKVILLIETYKWGICVEPCTNAVSLKRPTLFPGITEGCRAQLKRLPSWGKTIQVTHGHLYFSKVVGLWCTWYFFSFGCVCRRETELPKCFTSTKEVFDLSVSFNFTHNYRRVGGEWKLSPARFASVRDRNLI